MATNPATTSRADFRPTPADTAPQPAPDDEPDGNRGSLERPDPLERLDALHALLVAGGFAHGADAWLNAQDLLVRLARDGRLPPDRRRLRTLLAPIFCRGADDQRRFYTLFDQWLGSQRRTPVVSDVHPPPRPGSARARHQRAARFWPPLVVAAIVLALGGAAAYWVGTAQDTHDAGDPTRVSRSPKDAGSTARGIDEGSTTTAAAAPVDLIIVPRSPPERIELIEPAPASQVPPDTAARMAAYGFLARTAPFALALAFLLWHYRARRVLRRDAAEGGEAFTRLRLEGEPVRLFAAGDSSAAFRAMRVARRYVSRRLDPRRTVHATLHRGGLFTPVHRVRSQVAEYVVLIDRRHGADQGAALGRELVQRLGDEGFIVHAYGYFGDPRRLVAEHGDRHEIVTLTDLSTRFEGSRLLLLGDARGFVDPVTGAPGPALDALAAWSDRVFLSVRAQPSGPTERGLREAGFGVAELTSAGLADVAGTYAGERLRAASGQKRAGAGRRGGANTAPRWPPSLAGDESAWLEPNPPVGEDADAATARLLTELRAYLGPGGYLLLRAIAAYPAVHFGLTRALDALLNSARPDPAAREDRLLRVARLPWSRQAYMPDRVRLALLRDLSAPQRESVARAYATLLERLTADDTGDGVLELPIAVPPAAGLRRFLRDLVRGAPEDTALDDPIFANVLLGGRLGRLDFEVPRAVARLVPGGRRRLALLPGVLALGLAAGLALGADRLWRDQAIPWLEARAPTPPVDAAATRAEIDVTIVHTAATAALAEALRATLAERGFERLESRLDAAITGANRISLRSASAPTPDGAGAVPDTRRVADAATEIAARLRYLTYGAAVELEPAAAGNPPATTALAIEVVLTATLTTGMVFRDRLPVRAEASPDRVASGVNVIPTDTSAARTDARWRVSQPTEIPPEPVTSGIENSATNSAAAGVTPPRPVTPATVHVAPPRLALVIGNADYQDPFPALPTSTNDAEDIRNAFLSLGFEVELLINADLRETRSALARFSASLEVPPNRSALAVVYFAGHGVREKGRNYLIPVDFTGRSNKELENGAIRLHRDVIELLSWRRSVETDGAGPTAVILEASRRNPLGPWDGLAQLDVTQLPDGFLIGFSAAPGKASVGRIDSGAPQRNSLYTEEIVRRLLALSPNEGLQAFFEIVGSNVIRASANEQVPRVMSNLSEDVPLLPGAESPSAPTEELALWRKIEHSPDGCDFQHYLSKFPEGEFSAHARATLEAIERRIRAAEKAFTDLPDNVRATIAKSFQRQRAAGKARCEAEYGAGSGA